jgi:hypothetical protein
MDGPLAPHQVVTLLFSPRKFHLDGSTFLTNGPRELCSAKLPKPILWMVQHLRLDSPTSIAIQSIYDMF